MVKRRGRHQSQTSNFLSFFSNYHTTPTEVLRAVTDLTYLNHSTHGNDLWTREKSTLNVDTLAVAFNCKDQCNIKECKPVVEVPWERTVLTIKFRIEKTVPSDNKLQQLKTNYDPIPAGGWKHVHNQRNMRVISLTNRKINISVNAFVPP
ncbi:hypothetical protein TNCV_2884741 [Trichonephila clavipes]|nr:hypothetical protein TNCV_2884741 [Trichonephila clavipes]